MKKDLSGQEKLSLSSRKIKIFKWWSDLKQQQYSRRFEKHFEETQGRKILEEGQNKKGRPK